MERTAEQFFEECDKALDEFESGEDLGDEKCEECFHPVRLHDEKTGCDYESDRVRGEVLMAVRCGCKKAVRKERKNEGTNTGVPHRGEA